MESRTGIDGAPRAPDAGSEAYHEQDEEEEGNGPALPASHPRLSGVAVGAQPLEMRVVLGQAMGALQPRFP
jgi:hypothetical protein